MKLYTSKAIDKTIKKYEKLLDDYGFDMYDIADFIHFWYDNNVQIDEAFAFAEKAVRSNAKVFCYHSNDEATFYFLGGKLLSGGGADKQIVAKIEKEGKKQLAKMNKFLSKKE